MSQFSTNPIAGAEPALAGASANLTATADRNAQLQMTQQNNAARMREAQLQAQAALEAQQLQMQMNQQNNAASMAEAQLQSQTALEAQRLQNEGFARKEQADMQMQRERLQAAADLAELERAHAEKSAREAMEFEEKIRDKATQIELLRGQGKREEMLKAIEETAKLQEKRNEIANRSSALSAARTFEAALRDGKLPELLKRVEDFELATLERTNTVREGVMIGAQNAVLAVAQGVDTVMASSFTPRPGERTVSKLGRYAKEATGIAGMGRLLNGEATIFKEERAITPEMFPTQGKLVVESLMNNFTSNLVLFDEGNKDNLARKFVNATVMYNFHSSSNPTADKKAKEAYSKEAYEAAQKLRELGVSPHELGVLLDQTEAAFTTASTVLSDPANLEGLGLNPAQRMAMMGAMKGADFTSVFSGLAATAQSLGVSAEPTALGKVREVSETVIREYLLNSDFRTPEEIMHTMSLLPDELRNKLLSDMAAGRKAYEKELARRGFSPTDNLQEIEAALANEMSAAEAGSGIGLGRAIFDIGAETDKSITDLLGY